MTRGTTRMLMGILTLALLVTLAAPAYALGEIDGSTPGSIVVQAQEQDFQTDLQEAMVHVTVYQVATVNQYGAFALTDAFLDSLQNIPQWNGGILNNDTQVTALLDAALALVQPEEPAEGETPAEPANITPVFEDDVAANGGVIALGDPDTAEGRGLFLVIPGEVETAQWEYAFNPALLAVPSIARASENDDLDEDQWEYAVPMFLKGERERRLTSLVIEKTLQEYNATLGETTFIFEVTAVIDGETVYRNVVSLTFDGPGTGSVTVSGIPAGAHVTVREVYSGGSYTVVEGDTREIETLTAPEDGTSFDQVGFTNTYTDERIPDGSVVNRYAYDGFGWVYQGEEADQ